MDPNAVGRLRFRERLTAGEKYLAKFHGEKSSMTKKFHASCEFRPRAGSFCTYGN